MFHTFLGAFIILICHFNGHMKCVFLPMSLKLLEEHWLRIQKLIVTNGFPCLFDLGGLIWAVFGHFEVWYLVILRVKAWFPLRSGINRLKLLWAALFLQVLFIIFICFLVVLDNYLAAFFLYLVKEFLSVTPDLSTWTSSDKFLNFLPIFSK